MTMVLLCYFAIKNNIYIYHLLFTPYKSIKRNILLGKVPNIYLSYLRKTVSSDIDEVPNVSNKNGKK